MKRWAIAIAWVLLTVTFVAELDAATKALFRLAEPPKVWCRTLSLTDHGMVCLHWSNENGEIDDNY